ncbi:hypothetical protein N7451_011990 [Penicillium sp. IBT 35674x]|nr:hypothetical protein N7451_011990 [Penicillium sp. IBT 35674x]
MLQGIGLYAQTYSDIGTCENISGMWSPASTRETRMGKFKFIGGTDRFLDGEAFLRMDYGTVRILGSLLHRFSQAHIILFPAGGAISNWVAGRKGWCSINIHLDCLLIPVITGVSASRRSYLKAADGSSDIFFSDDVILGRKKKGLYQLLFSLKSMDELTAAREASMSIKSQAVVKSEAALGYWLATGEEFAGSSLCLVRPKPEYYDPLYLSRALKGNMFVLIRPHRIIYAARNDAAQLQKLVSQAVAYLHE